jgi:hypothetical protein
MKNKFFFFLTPCIIAAVGLFVMMTDGLLFSQKTKGESIAAFKLALPFFIGYVVADYILRRIFQRKLVTIWIVEIIIILLSAYFFWNNFPFKSFTVQH